MPKARLDPCRHEGPKHKLRHCKIKSDAVGKCPAGKGGAAYLCPFGEQKHRRYPRRKSRRNPQQDQRSEEGSDAAYLLKA